MISLEVVDTDAFLDMPQSSQLLYFHLSVRADDDGFVSNPRKIARTLGASVDDMKVLIGKKFIIAFDDGVCVIKHWRINNFIRKDIYKETKYLNLKQTLFIRPNGAYTLNDDGNAVPVPKGHFQLESVNATLTERQLSIGKDRVGKERKDKKDITLRVIEKNPEENSLEAGNKEIPEIIKLFESVNPSVGKFYGNKTQRAAVERMLKVYGREKLEAMIAALPNINARMYWPKSTTPLQLEDNIPKYKAKNDEEKARGNEKKNERVEANKQKFRFTT